MQLSIIIVNYNVKYFLEHCLLSVTKACANVHAEIFVVDNNSSDGSETYLTQKFNDVHFFWNKTNLGFGKANNSMLAHVKGDYVLFLNPDTIVTEDCFTNCINFFNNNKDCGALGVKMIDGGGQYLKESKRSLPSPWSGFCKMTGLTATFPNSKLFAQYYAGHVAENDNANVAVLAGAFMMLSKKAIDITNGFDETFFMYGEDIDLSYRIQKAGFQNYYVGQNTIIHFKGESTQKQSKQYLHHFYGAMKLFVGKHYSHNLPKLFLMNVAIELGKLSAILKNIFFIAEANNSTSLKNILIVGHFESAKNAANVLQNTITSIVYFEDEIIKEKIQKAVIQNNCNAIVFCEDEHLSNKIIIDLINKNNFGCEIFFYQKSANSIVGSSNKNQKGIFFTKH